MTLGFKFFYGKIEIFDFKSIQIFIFNYNKYIIVRLRVKVLV